MIAPSVNEGVRQCMQARQQAQAALNKRSHKDAPAAQCASRTGQVQVSWAEERHAQAAVMLLHNMLEFNACQHTPDMLSHT